MPKVRWKLDPAEKDYGAAMDYLTLIMSEREAARIVARLRRAAIVRRKAKDILRASELVLLPRDNTHVASDLAKVRRGRELSPILLVRGRPALVADGYHRVCASYWTDEDTDIPCRLV